MISKLRSLNLSDWLNGLWIVFVPFKSIALLKMKLKPLLSYHASLCISSLSFEIRVNIIDYENPVL